MISAQKQWYLKCGLLVYVSFNVILIQRTSPDIPYKQAIRNDSLIPPLPGSYVGRSTCNEEVTMMGAGQKVVSYCFYIEQTNEPPDEEKAISIYLALRDHLAERIAEVYPGWRMRIYTNVLAHKNGQSQFPRTNGVLQNFSRSYSHVDLCNINYVRANEIFKLSKYGYYTSLVISPFAQNWQDIKNIFGFSKFLYVEQVPFGMFWRWLPLGDPTVERFLSRDLDAYILDREVPAVEEWLHSGRQFHIMRDCRSHSSPIPANIWAAANIGQDGTIGLTNYLRDRLMSTGIGRYGYGSDQKNLGRILWPTLRQGNMSYIHDAYRCQDPIYGNEVHPFPTQRVNYTWIGFGPKREDMRVKRGKTECPEECRPKNHTDWLYC